MLRMRDGLNWDYNPASNNGSQDWIVMKRGLIGIVQTVKDSFWTKTKRGFAKATKM